MKPASTPPPRNRKTTRQRRQTSLFAQAALVIVALSVLTLQPAGGLDSKVPDGLRLLLEKPLSMRVMSLDELETLWTVWEPEAQRAAEESDAEERRRLVFARYGLIERDLPGLEADLRIPLGYVADESGGLYPNCLTCHGGSVAGQVIPGLPNSQQELTSLVTDLATLRARRAGKDPAEAASSATFGFPLNFVRGSTNATMYSILLGSMRDEHLDLQFPPVLSQPFVHNSIDAPPWWHFKKKSRIYWDGMAPKSVRTLMQFTMAPGLSGAKIRSWESDFEVIRDYISGLEPPVYPFAIDSELAERGRVAFESTCSPCHGTYASRPGDAEVYPERTVPIGELGTDPKRLEAIHPSSKAKYNESWFANYGEHPVVVDTPGYVAPPLDGIWATAPYLHNGSVPTLWHLLHPAERPGVWRRAGTGYDNKRVGLLVDVAQGVPDEASQREQREYFDTSQPSHSAAGHLFPEQLNTEQRRAVLEYLKTL